MIAPELTLQHGNVDEHGDVVDLARTGRGTIAAVRRDPSAGWHLVPVAMRPGGEGLEPIATTLCDRYVAGADLVDVIVNRGRIAELLAGVECCRDCRLVAIRCEVTS